MKLSLSLSVLIFLSALIGLLWFGAGNWSTNNLLVGSPQEAEKVEDKGSDIEVTIETLHDEGIFYHEERGWKVQLPLTTQVERFTESDLTETVVFFDVDTGQEFQLFMARYALEEITEKRLRLDIPSGDIRDPHTIVLENGKEAMLFSTHISGLGEVKELWLIHEGYLYEFTVKTEWESWFGEIMRSWQFID